MEKLLSEIMPSYSHQLSSYNTAKPNTFRRIKVLSCLFETNLHPITIMIPRNITNGGQFVILGRCENRWILKNPLYPQLNT